MAIIGGATMVTRRLWKGRMEEKARVTLPHTGRRRERMEPRGEGGAKNGGGEDYGIGQGHRYDGEKGMLVASRWRIQRGDGLREGWWRRG